ncbi:hypothetical protein C8J56DRAFT_1050446 [Mycena floridula]|nr:hypothetical protein C8J56DRAFT_1050446 [Mycena floridula]
MSLGTLECCFFELSSTVLSQSSPPSLRLTAQDIRLTDPGTKENLTIIEEEPLSPSNIGRSRLLMHLSRANYIIMLFSQPIHQKPSIPFSRGFSHRSEPIIGCRITS